MTKTELDDAIAKRAQAEVDKAWLVFKSKISAAVTELVCGQPHQLKLEEAQKAAAYAILQERGYSDRETLPAVLWSLRRERITAEILSTMDTLQQTRSYATYEPEITPPIEDAKP